MPNLASQFFLHKSKKQAWQSTRIILLSLKQTETLSKFLSFLLFIHYKYVILKV